MKQPVTTYFQSLQDSICKALEQLDGTASFREDKWERPGGGGGRSRVINGELIEKGGVNFSAVEGELNERAQKALGINTAKFYATGVSIVLHPKNPWVPIIHMNVRYFEGADDRYWFGGGIDVTPHYVRKEDARFFHSYLKNVCDRHDPAYYPKFKTWADDYFYIRHRKETRGIGGIFFDRLSTDEQHAFEDRFGFVREVGESFVPIYTHLATQNRDRTYGPREQQWQALRRGRYVEFNLVWDRGTKFGLETDGRTESILMSLPPVANWQYSHHPEPGSTEAETLGFLRKGVDWISGSSA